MKIKLNIRNKDFCNKFYKKERKKFYSNFELNQIRDNKRFRKTIKPNLKDKCIQSSPITLKNNESFISDDFRLSQTFNNYFKSAAEKIGIKECEVSSHVNPNSGSTDDVDVAIENSKDYTIIKIIIENVSLESRFSSKEIRESDIRKEVFNLNSKKAGTFGNNPTKVLKNSSNICNSILQNMCNYEILGKQYFPKNLKLSDITPVYKKKNPIIGLHLL